MQIQTCTSFGDTMALGASSIPLLGPARAPSVQMKAVDTEWKVPILRCHIDGKELSTFKDGYFAHLTYRRE